MFITEKIKKIIDEHKIISFDVFDTLILRKFISPYDVFKYIEQVYLAPNFTFERQVAHCKAIQAQDDNYDVVNLDEIYSCMPLELKKFQQVELMIERCCICANPAIQEVFNYAKSHGKRIICISDTYFSAEFIKKMLIEVGYDTPLDKIFTSNQCRARKSDGRLFQYVIKNLDVNPKDIAHFGDSQQSDYIMARKNNIFAYKTPCVFNEFSRNRQNQKFIKLSDALSDSIITKIVLGAYVCRWWKNKILNISDDFWYSIGYTIMAPFVYGYVNFIRDKINPHQKSDLLFIARDGYVLKECFDKFNKNKNITSHYIYAPRMVKILGDLDFANKPEYLKTLIEYYSKINAEFAKAFSDKMDFEQLKSVFDKNKDKISRLASEVKQEYIKYINTVDFASKHRMLVDLSSGSMSSQRLLNDVIKPGIECGFYAGSTNKNLPHFGYADTLHTVEMDFIYEILLSSPEYPIVGFADSKPIFKQPDDIEQKNKVVFAKSHTGISDFFNDIFIPSNKCAWVYNSFIQYQNLFWVYVSKKEAKDLKNAMWAYDAMSTRYLRVYSHWYKHVYKKRAEIARANGVHNLRALHIKNALISLIPIRKWR